jgi:prevent-host-death family protein
MSKDRISPPVQTATDIVPIAEFKAKAPRYIERIRESNHPLIITQHGKAAAVVLSPEEFDRLQQIQYERHFLTALVKGQNEGLQGMTVPHEEVKEQLRERYSSPKKSATK